MIKIDKQKRTYIFIPEKGKRNIFVYEGVEEVMVLSDGHQILFDDKGNYFLVKNNWLAIDIVFEKEKYTKEESTEAHLLTFEIRVEDKVINFKVDKVVKISPDDGRSLVHLIREDGSVFLLPAGSKMIGKEKQVEEEKTI